MDAETRIHLDTLQRAAIILLQDVSESFGSAISVDADYFWAIPRSQRKNVYVEPSEFAIGQVSESLDPVTRVVEDPTRSLPYALVWLADVLREVGGTLTERDSARESARE